MPTQDRACSASARAHSLPRRRARMSKHRVTINDTERRAASTPATGRLNQGVLRDLWTLAVRPCGRQRSTLPLFRVRLQPFRCGPGKEPLGTSPSLTPACRRAARGAGDLLLDRLRGGSDPSCGPRGNAPRGLTKGSARTGVRVLCSLGWRCLSGGGQIDARGAAGTDVAGV